MKIVLNGLRGIALRVGVALVFLHGATSADGAKSPFSETAWSLAETFFQSARFSSVDLSPGGSRLAVYYRQDGHEMVVVRELPDGQPRPIVELPDPEARLSWIEWASDTRLLFAVEEPLVGVRPPRPRRTRLYGIDADGSNHQHLARNWGKYLLLGRGDFQHEADLIDLLPDDPGHVLISVRKPTDRYPGAYKLDVASGGLEPVMVPTDGVSRWYADHDGRVRAGFGYEHGKYKLFARTDTGSEIELLHQYGAGDEAMLFEGFGFEPAKIYVSKPGAHGRDALYEYDLATKSVGRELFSHPEFDVPAWLEFSEKNRSLAQIVYDAEGRERHFTDDDAARDQAFLDRALAGTFNRVTSESRDKTLAIVRSVSDTQAPKYYLYDRDRGTLDLLFASYPALADRLLAPMKPVSYEARDGTRVPAYLTLPEGGPPRGLPAVVYPHGGPSARDRRGFELVTQYFAALGFAVLQPNYRGSTGYGHEYQAAGFQEWGLAMQDDLTDGVDWLVESGVADPGRICIYGASYGGYAALMGLVKTPDKFRCAGAYAAPTDLVMLLNHEKGYLFSDRNGPRIGRTSKDRERLRSTSPLHNIDRIRAPVFLAHGEDDDRVHVAHSTKLAKALKKAGKPVEIVVIPDEAHSFRDEARRIDYYARLGSFLLANTKPVGGAS